MNYHREKKINRNELRYHRLGGSFKIITRRTLKEVPKAEE